MRTITLVTGNPNKLVELRKILPESLGLASKKLDLDEIQSLDLYQIVRHKLRQAYDALGTPVIVEDVSAQLEKLNGLPGPFIKFFEQKLGKEALYILGGESPARIVCAMGYYDGKQEHIVDGVLEGRIVAPRPGEGWGFDFVLIPDGYDQTLSQLGPETKNRISHRFRAATALAGILRSE